MSIPFPPPNAVCTGCGYKGQYRNQVWHVDPGDELQKIPVHLRRAAGVLLGHPEKRLLCTRCCPRSVKERVEKAKSRFVLWFAKLLN